MILRLIRAMKVETLRAHVAIKTKAYKQVQYIVQYSTVLDCAGITCTYAGGREKSKMADFQSILAALLSPDNDMRTRAEVSTIV